MYSSNFVVAIMRNGNFCEESKSGIVTIPFDSQYSIRLRNKNSRRAVAFVSIDDENVGNIIVDANSYVDLERPVSKANKFKFVSATSGEAIDAGKNNKGDDSNGVIRVEWKLEKEYTRIQTFNRFEKSLIGSRGREGCTVEGNYSSQKFSGVNMETEEGNGVIIQLVLKGFYEENKKSSRYCKNCGQPNPDMYNFCSNCGSQNW